VRQQQGLNGLRPLVAVAKYYKLYLLQKQMVSVQQPPLLLMLLV
jgi:hypothetical protein